MLKTDFPYSVNYVPATNEEPASLMVSARIDKRLIHEKIEITDSDLDNLSDYVLYLLGCIAVTWRMRNNDPTHCLST